MRTIHITRAIRPISSQNLLTMNRCLQISARYFEVQLHFPRNSQWNFGEKNHRGMNFVQFFNSLFVLMWGRLVSWTKPSEKTLLFTKNINTFFLSPEKEKSEMSLYKIINSNVSYILRYKLIPGQYMLRKTHIRRSSIAINSCSLQENSETDLFQFHSGAPKPWKYEFKRT